MTDVQVVIVGSGFAGLGAAARLEQAGRGDFLVLEKAGSLGGTWRDNTYPGCACDVPALLYSFSFAPKRDWSRMYARQAEIRAYLEEVADRFRLRDRIRFGVPVDAAEYDEDSATWHVHTATGQTITARAVIWGVGALHEPAVPDIEGLDSFAGTVFHSARWRHDHDLAGRCVAVVGTGASAVQFVPRIARDLAHLAVFQRTPAWIVPKLDRPLTALEHRLHRWVPGLQRLHRASVYARMEARVGGFLHPRFMTVLDKVARGHLARQVTDPRLRAALTPDYTIGCKRILISNDFYPALGRENVELVTDPIVRVTADAVVTADGREHPVDTIVLGTGFRVADSMDRVAITGRGGAKLSDVWRAGKEAHVGTTVAGFPNLFLLTGPNTGLGHNSMIYMIESQLRYVLGALDLLERTGADAVDTVPARQAAYNADVQRRMAGTVWTAGGCASWYLDADGTNRTLWPGTTFRFRRRARRVDPADHELLRAA